MRFWALRKFLATGRPLAILRRGRADEYPGLGDELVAFYKTPPADVDAPSETVNNLISAYLASLSLSAAVELQGIQTVTQVGVQAEQRESLRNTSAATFDNNLAAIPLVRANEARLLRSAWPAVERFVHEFAAAPDRKAALRSWHDQPPAWLQDRPSAAHTWFAQLASDYGEKEVASAAFEEAIDAGATPTSYWRIRDVLNRVLDPDERAKLLAPYRDDDRIAAALVLVSENNLPAAISQLSEWTPTEPRDAVTRGAVLSQLLGATDLDKAIDLSRHCFSAYGSGTCGILQAKFLIHRGRARESQIDIADLENALDIALKARNVIRGWEGPSGQAVEIAVLAARLLGRDNLAWSLTQTPPEGVAIPPESQDPSVRQVAALLAAQLGRKAEALELLPDNADPVVQSEVRAMIAVLDDDEATQRLEWNAALEHATDPDDIARIALSLAMLGERTPRISELRSTDPEHTNTVELIADAFAGNDESIAILRARSLTTRLLTRAFIGLLIQRDQTEELASVAERAGNQWSDADFMNLAAEVYQSSGAQLDAERCAAAALRIAGPTWEHSYRANVILISAILAQERWQDASRIATDILSRHPHDVSAIWILTQCHYQLVELDEAWRAYSKIGGKPDPRSEDEALVRIDLWRRFENTYADVPILAALLDAFPASGLIRQAITAALMFVELENDDIQALDYIRGLLTPLLDEQRDVFIQKDIDPEDPLASFTEILGEMPAGPRHDPRIDDGRLPIGMAATIYRKSLTEVLATLSSAPIFSGNQDTFESEVSTAIAARGGKVIVDITALYALSVLDGSVGDQLLGTFVHPEATRAQRIDAITGCDSLSRLSTLSIGRGDDGTAFPITITDDEASLRYQRAQQIYAQFERLALDTGIEIENFAEVGNNARSFSWLSAVDHAISSDAALWCDDRATRMLAAQRNVQTFGTQALIEALRRKGEITVDGATVYQASLIRAYFVGLRVVPEWLNLAGTLASWRPSGAAAFITHCAPVADASVPLNFVLHAMRLSASDPEAVRGWVSAVSRLLIRMGGTRESAHSNLVTLLSNLLQEAWLESSKLPFVIAGVRDAVGRSGIGDPLAPAIERHYQLLVESTGWETAAVQLRNLVRLAEPSDRVIATGVVLGYKERE